MILCSTGVANERALSALPLLLQVRVVKSAKDRSFEAIRTSVGQIRSKIKINDWNGIQSNFDECNKHVDKSKVCVGVNCVCCVCAYTRGCVAEVHLALVYFWNRISRVPYGILARQHDTNERTIEPQAMIAKEGVPSFYIKLLANLEDLLATTLKDKPAIKKMSATNTRSLNRMKLQLRKHNKG